LLNRRRAEGPFVDTDLDTLATALYVTCDDLLVIRPEHAPYRPESGFEPAITDAELITLAVMSALLGYTSERRWLRYAHQNLRAMFPALPGQSGYNKRLRKLAPTIAWLIGVLVADTSVGDDDLWVVDSTPSNVLARPRRSNARIWPGGPSTATAPRTPATSGVCDCICCAPCTDCPWGGR